MTSISASGDRGPPILGIRDFRLFMGGRLLSILSTQMQAVAVGWQVYDITHDPLTLGYVGLAGFLPIATLTLPAGAVPHRFDRRPTLPPSHSPPALCGPLIPPPTLPPSAAVSP